MSLPRGLAWVVGLDLGTTNSAVSRVALDEERLEDVPVHQRISEGEVSPRRVLPSFLYLPGPHELPEGALALPWDADRGFLVGEYARTQGSRVPGRVVSSAKSWLAHRRADPTEPLLPWEAVRDAERVSAVEASRRYLSHLRESWDAGDPQHPLPLQDVVLTVPASFDEVARELTVLAADQAGLERVTLLEEPQAAFYAWLWERQGRWKQELSGTDLILVCDIGGGTTDFTLIRVGESLERVAVGDHLMLGGDNLDIALAHRVEGRLGGDLDLLQWGVLRHECRRAKELLLGDDPPEEATLTVPGSGARLLAGARTAEVTRAEVEALVLDGFFPRVGLDDPVQGVSGAGLREWGLPYASDPAVPRHLGAFLRRHGVGIPDAVLFNGGACRPAAIRQRIASVLQEWGGREVRVLENPASDLAVARGAAAYGWLKRHGRERIRGGIARSYYLGVGEDQAVCVIHRNQEEGELVSLAEPELKLVVGRPVTFPLFAASDRPQDAAGAVVPQEPLQALGALQTVVRKAGDGSEEVPVHLSARVTEVGTLAVWASTLDGARRWALELPMRGRRVGNLSETAPERVDQARALIVDTFGQRPMAFRADLPRPRTLIAALEEILGHRDTWPPALLRSLWESFLSTAARRRTDPEWESAWLNGAGFCLRPGVGYPLDDWRVEQMAALLPEWLQFTKEDRVRREWWVFWRRIAAGLTQARQEELWAQMSPHLLPGRRHLKTRVKNLLPSEAGEFLRLAVSLERLALSEKEALGVLLRDRFKARPEDCWLMARLGARRLVGGGPQHVLSPEVVEPWVALFLSQRWKDARAAGFALAEIARRTGDRRLDLSEEVRRAAAARLRTESLVEAARTVEEIVEVDAEDKARLLGEALPVGLRL